MRPILIATVILLSSLAQVQAQMAPIMPPSTYPEPGTFCGFLTLCGATEITSEGES